MKRSKKKRRSRTSNKPILSQPVNCEDDNKEQTVVECKKDGQDRKDLNNLRDEFASFSLPDVASDYIPAHLDLDSAAEIPGVAVESAEDRSTVASSSTSQSTGSSTLGDLADDIHPSVCGKVLKGRRSKQKKIVAAAGLVSTILGKDYVTPTPKKRDPENQKGLSTAEVSKEETEQFLRSMLGEDCELGMAVVRDVLCLYKYDVEKALNALLELSASSFEQYNSFRFSGNFAKADAGTKFLREPCDSLTNRASNSASQSSESDIQDNMRSLGCHSRSYVRALATAPPGNTPSHPGYSKSEFPHIVLESLFNMPTPKSCEYNPSTMNWRNVVKKLQSLGQQVDNSHGNITTQKDSHAKDNEYNDFREDAKLHWDSMKQYYQKAATAYSNGAQEYAAYLSEQGRLQSRMARKAEDKASKDIFDARNKNIENVITVDLHGQHVKQAMKLLKLHLLFGAYVRSVRYFRVITGCGSHMGKSKLKQSVIDLVNREGIKWSEENRGALIIRLDGHREFSFLDSESDCD